MGGVFVGEGGRVSVIDFDGEFEGGEVDDVLEGLGGGDGSSSSMVVGLSGGESLTTSSSSLNLYILW